MLCAQCGSQSSGSFCDQCGAVLKQSTPQNGDLFSKSTGREGAKFWKSALFGGFVLSLAIGLAVTGFFWASLHSSQDEVRASVAQVNRQSGVLAQAKNEYNKSLNDFFARIDCVSSTWVCDIVHGDLTTLVAESSKAEKAENLAKSELAESERALAVSRETSAELELNVTYSAMGGGALAIILLVARVFTYRSQTQKI